MVTVTSNLGVGVNKKFLEKMANGLLAVNISGSPVVGARWKATKKYIFLLRSLPYIVTAWEIYLKSCYYLDEVWLTTYLTSP